MIHVPKCGGTSIGSALRLSYFYSQETVDIKMTEDVTYILRPGMKYDDRERFYLEYDLRDAMAADAIRRNVRCLSGHFRFHEGIYQNTKDNRIYTTILRHPVKRFISHFRYVRARHGAHKVDHELEAFLATEKALRYGSHYLFYFAGVFQSESQNLKADVKKAVQALKKFNLVGFVDDMDGYRHQLQSVLNTRILDWHRNSSPDTQPIDLSDEIMKQIEEVNAPDIEIYETIRRELNSCMSDA